MTMDARYDKVREHDVILGYAECWGPSASTGKGGARCARLRNRQSTLSTRSCPPMNSAIDSWHSSSSSTWLERRNPIMLQLPP